MGNLISKLFDKFLLFIPVGILGNLVFAYYFTEKSHFDLGRFSPRYLVLAIILAFLPWLAHALRVYVWIQFLNHSVSYKESLKIVVSAELAAAVSPTVVGGSPVKWGMLVKHGLKPVSAATLTSINVLEEVTFFTLTILVILIFGDTWGLPRLFFFSETLEGLPDFDPEYLLFLLPLGYGIHFISLNESSRFPLSGRLRQILKTVSLQAGHFLAEAKRVFGMIGTRGKLLFCFSLVITGSQWISRCSVATALIWGLGIEIDPVRMFFLQILIFLTLVGVPTPGAIGGAEVSFYLFLESVIPAGAIGVVLTGWRFLTYYCQLLLGVALNYLLGLNAPAKPAP